MFHHRNIIRTVVRAVPRAPHLRVAVALALLSLGHAGCSSEPPTESGPYLDPGDPVEAPRRWRLAPAQIEVEACAAGSCAWLAAPLPGSCGHIGDGLRALEHASGDAAREGTVKLLASCSGDERDLARQLASARAATGLRDAELLALAELWYDAVLTPHGVAPACDRIAAALSSLVARVPPGEATGEVDVEVQDGRLMGVPARLLGVARALDAVGEPAGGLVGQRGLAGFWMIAAGFFGADHSCGTLNHDAVAVASARVGSPPPLPAPGSMAITMAPALWMPFPSGTVHLCTQGNSGATSHASSSTRHGLDFDTPNSGPAERITAALAGRVGFIQSGCVVGSTACGAGFGNHVKLDHGGRYYTMYGHLSSVSVARGNKVGRGALIGYEGTTGSSTGDHLHFALHQGDPSALAVAPTISYFLRSRDVSSGGAFTDLASASYTCGIPGGHRYESDNACTAVHDSLATARPLTNNIPYSSELCTEGDVDYFSFGGRAGPFTARIKSTSQSISDCSCAILDASGIELPRGGAEGYDRDDGYNGGEGCACTLSLATSAVHYLKIFAHMPGAYVLEKALP